MPRIRRPPPLNLVKLSPQYNKKNCMVRLVKDVETGEDLAVKLEPQLAKANILSFMYKQKF
jgi:hypothetical protein